LEINYLWGLKFLKGMKIKNIFENTIANIISSIVILLFTPITNILNNMNNSITENLFLNPNFITSVILSVFLVILFQFIRKIYLKMIAIEKQMIAIEEQMIAIKELNSFLLRKIYQQFNEFGLGLKQHGIEIKKIKITETEKMLLKDLPDDIKKELDKFMSI
jgi:hypothetical protein